MTGSVLFDTRIGDVKFPGLQPATSSATATLDSTPVGSLSPSTGDFTTIGANTPPNTTVSHLHVDTGTKTATATAGAATLNKMSGTITSEALTTAAGSTYTLTLTNSDIAANDIVMTSVAFGTSTTGVPDVATTTVSAGQLVVVVQNASASAAFNGTIKIAFVVFKN